jgi:cytochrome c-type biogenesis protein CcmE
MKRKHQRLLFFIVSVVLVSIALTLILKAFNQNLVFFYSPSDLNKNTIASNQMIRVGGLVVSGSISHPKEGEIVFTVTDNVSSLQIVYKGIVPTLFREGQGMIAEGHLQADGSLKATRILAKHDENYMPPEVAASLKKSGHWKDQYQKKVTP